MQRSIPVIGLMTLAALAACGTDPVSPARAPGALGAADVPAGNNTVVVTGADVATQPENSAPTRSWVLYFRNAGSGDFVTGPSTPPLGVGSFELTTPSGTDKAFLFNYDHIGTTLASIDAISYSTYRDPASTAVPVQLPAINMEVDYNGPDVAGGFTTLVFEPVYNTTQGAILPGVWQHWDAFNGIWWSTKAIPGVCAFSCYVTWQQIVAANPNATILGGFGVNQGSGNGGLIGAVDALELGVSGNSVTYDFEPYRTPATADDCKNDGYQTVKTADGDSFSNQGRCIQYVNTGK